jgi:ribose transport system substrate-binding protein
MRKVILFVLCLAIAVPTFAGGGGESNSGVIKIGVAIPSADHGWTGGIVWWANKWVKELESANKGKLEFTVVIADSASL